MDSLWDERPRRTGKYLKNRWKKRRKRDSNPRYGSPYSGFQDRRFQPLTHSSAFEDNAYDAGNSRYRIVRSFFRLGFPGLSFSGAETGSGCLIVTVPKSVLP